MTLAAVSIEPDTAEAMLLRFRSMTGLKNELKGSRIDLAERALFFKLFKDSGARYGWHRDFRRPARSGRGSRRS
jgi:hypothetical protein